MCLVSRMSLTKSAVYSSILFFFFFQAEDGIRDYKVTGVQTCALPIWAGEGLILSWISHAILPSGRRIGFAKAFPGERSQKKFHDLLQILPVPITLEIGRASCRERV